MAELLLLLWFASPGAAAPPPVPPDRGALALIRTLSYDRALDRRSGPLRLAVVAPPGAEVGRQVHAAIAGLVGVAVGGRALAAPLAAPTGDPAPWAVRLAAIDAVLLCPGIDGDELRAVIVAARDLDVGTLALDGAYVGRGAAIGVRPAGSRLELVVDLDAAAAEGAALSGELLEVARRVAP